MEDCSSITYLDSLLTVCNTDKYQSICLDDRNGHVSCNMTIGGPFSIDGDLQHFFLPYGTVAWISNVIGIWIGLCLVDGKAPLNPTRAIKHRTFVLIIGIASILFLGVTALVRVPQLKNRNMKIIAIGHVVAVAIIQGTVLCLMMKDTPGHKESEKQEDTDKGTRVEESTESTNKNDATPRPSSELARSTSSASTVVSVSEKPGFLNKITSRIPGAQKTETASTTREENTETPKKEESVAEGLRSLFVGMLCLMSGHVVISCGVIGIAKQIFAKRRVTDVRQQREVRDTLILFGVIIATAIISSIIAVIAKASADASQSPHEEDADREAAEKKRAAEVKTLREVVIFGVVILSGVVGLWCQYFVLAAVARDTHGIVHLGQTSNLSLVYVILSKLLLFAF